MVKSIQARPRAGANLALTTLLTAVAPGLQELGLQPPESHIFDAQWQSNYSTSIFFHMLAFDKMAISFPALTHITIGTKLVIYRNTIDQLLGLAPNLRYLDIDLTSANDDDWSRNGHHTQDGQGSTSIMAPTIPTRVEWHTHLTELRLKGRSWGGAYPDSIYRLFDYKSLQHVEVSGLSKRTSEGDNIIDLICQRAGLRSVRFPHNAYKLLRHNKPDDAIDGNLFTERLSVSANLDTAHFEVCANTTWSGAGHDEWRG